MHKPNVRSLWTVSVTFAVLCGVLSIVVVFVGEASIHKNEVLATVLAQLAGSVFVVGTLFFQYYTFRKEQMQYYEERNRELFFRLTNELSKAIDSLCITDIFADKKHLNAENALEELYFRHELLKQILSETAFFYNTEDKEKQLIKELEESASLRDELCGTEPELERASVESFRKAQQELSNYRKGEILSKTYSVDFELWKTCCRADDSEKEREVVRRFWTIHCADLRQLHFSYIAIEDFLLQHPTYQKDKYLYFLYSLFSVKHIEFLSSCVDNLSLIGRKSPSFLIKLLKSRTEMLTTSYL